MDPESPTLGPTIAERSPYPSVPGMAGLPPGALVAGRFRILGFLGRGGMGEVYRAEDLKLGQEVALKFLPPELERDPERLRRFHGEVRLARQVSHPNVCRVYDIAEVEGHHFLTMEFVDGETLGSLLRRIGRLPEDKAVEIAQQLCAALQAIHSEGVVHRDLKPANIMLDGRGRARITDFGLASLSGAQQRAEIAGTPAYMAPELFTGEPATVASDLYALGLVLYEVFTGKGPFGGATTVADWMRVHRHEDAPTPSALGRQLDPLIEEALVACLAKAPAARPRSALALAARLPGGDPLAAALAAGETPSPEMLAAAPQEGALTPARAWAALGFVLVALPVAIALSHRLSALSLAPLPKPPEVIAAEAQAILARLGEAQPVGDRAFDLTYHGFLTWLQDHGRGRPELRAGIAAGRPSPIVLWYRERPVGSLIVPKRSELPFPHNTSREDPPLVIAGEARLILDPTGRLLALDRIPGGGPAASTSAGLAPPWQELFAAAGLELAEFREVTPRVLPPVYADRVASWEPRASRPGLVPDRVDAAAIGGQPVHFATVWPWSAARPVDAKLGVLGLVQAALLVMAIVGAALLARRNLRLGRGDLRGARRMLVYAAVLIMVMSSPRPRHLATWTGFSNLLVAGAWSLFIAGAVALVYLALEPYARRRWPRAAISWARLLAGRVRDAMVGRDILLGIALGFAIVIAFAIAELFAERAAGLPAPVRGPFIVPMARPAIAYWDIVIAPLYGFVGLAVFLVPLFLLRALLRSDRWAIVAMSLIVGLITSGGGSGVVLAVNLAIAIVAAFVFLWATLRLGILVSVAAQVTAHYLSYPLSFDLGAWTTQRSLPVIVALLALTIYAFVTSLGGHRARLRLRLED